jgi:hypothetical protein
MESDSMDADPREIGATQADAFGALLRALKLFIDDLQLLLQPEFHRFMDLPAELRLQVYNHYCINDTKSLACHKWVSADKLPTMTFHSVSHGPYSSITSVPFLPDLCLVNQTIRAEAMIFNLRTLEYGIGILDRTRAAFFHLKLGTCSTIPLGENVLRLDLSYEQGIDYSTLMARCHNIQVLDLRLDFERKLNVQSVLDLKNLQQVNVSGVGMPSADMVKTKGGYTFTSSEEDIRAAKAELTAGTEVARQIKNGFESSHRKVQVQTTLTISCWSIDISDDIAETTTL